MKEVKQPELLLKLPTMLLQRRTRAQLGVCSTASPSSAIAVDSWLTGFDQDLLPVCRVCPMRAIRPAALILGMLDLDKGLEARPGQKLGHLARQIDLQFNRPRTI